MRLIEDKVEESNNSKSELISKDELKCFFYSIHSKGIDGISTYKLKQEDRIESFIKNLYILLNNIKEGQKVCKFSPYIQKLILKGKSKHPREISIPTVRDSIILKTINNKLRDDLKPKSDFQNNLHQKICSVKKELQECYLNVDEFIIIKTDIKNFYPTINHDLLIEKLKKECKDQYLIELIKSAIKTSTVCLFNYNKKGRSANKKGLPQGLPISNVLAELYLQEFDKSILKKEGIKNYTRYVDDIFVILSKEKKEGVIELIVDELDKLGLEKNADKDSIYCINSSNDNIPEFLGYEFKFKDNKEISISIKEDTFRKHKSRLYNVIHGISKFIEEKKKDTYEKDNKKLFVMQLKAKMARLKRKVTGCIWENKFYGFLYYFKEINNIEQLKKFNCLLYCFLKKKKLMMEGGKYNYTISEAVNTNLCFFRAYYKIKHIEKIKCKHKKSYKDIPQTYIDNFDKFTIEQMCVYLSEYSYVNSKKDNFFFKIINSEEYENFKGEPYKNGFSNVDKVPEDLKEAVNTLHETFLKKANKEAHELGRDIGSHLYY